jgi:hypothetical protein
VHQYHRGHGFGAYRPCDESFARAYAIVLRATVAYGLARVALARLGEHDEAILTR